MHANIRRLLALIDRTPATPRIVDLRWLIVRGDKAWMVVVIGSQLHEIGFREPQRSSRQGFRQEAAQLKIGFELAVRDSIAHR